MGLRTLKDSVSALPTLPSKQRGRGVWEGQEVPAPGDGLGLTLTPGRGMAGPYMTHEDISRVLEFSGWGDWKLGAAGAEPQPDPKAQWCPGAPRPIPRPLPSPAAPREDSRTLEVACRVHTHPALPLSNVPPPPTHPQPSTGGQRDSGDRTPASGRGATAHFQQPSIATAPTLPAVPLQRSCPPSLKTAGPRPRPAPSRPFLFSPQAHGPTRLRRQPSPSLKAPSLRIPSPGAGQQGGGKPRSSHRKQTDQV
ncbi:translation initiation factor IF-2-like isoform X1 [Physeter macrocephalus]|uniref:Translation initiation factor IF-2-like isoform X1 n=1 Tax=Physeter macrocephalus TaxID=9755 RepID=A0A9W2WUL1_PHYMC|nr:translation initiation factor IF-2-like isoform X1 [Physeter catodon]